MAADEVFVKIRFKYIDSKEARKAKKTLTDLNSIQKISTRDTTRLGRRGRSSGKYIEASGRIGAEAYKKEAVSVNKAVDSVKKLNTFSLHNFDITKKEATASAKLQSLRASEIKYSRGLGETCRVQNKAQVQLGKIRKTVASDKKKQQAQDIALLHGQGEAEQSYFNTQRMQARARKVMDADAKKRETAAKTGISLVNKQQAAFAAQYPLLRNVNMAQLEQRPILNKAAHGYMRLSGVMAKHSAQQSILFQTSSKLRRAAWSITWGAMSMLGVFFGGFAVLRMFTRAAEMLIRPLTDINKLAESIAKAYGFGLMFGIGPFAAGILNLKDMLYKLPDAFMASQAVVMGLAALMADLVITLFTNEEALAAFAAIFVNLADIWPDLKDMFMGLIIGLLKVAKFITADEEVIIHFIETLAVFVTSVVEVILNLLFFGLRAAGLGGYVDALSSGIASAEGPWEKLGAVVAAFTGVLVPASLAAMLFLPGLSLIQVGVLAASAVFWILGFAVNAGSVLIGLLGTSAAGAAPVMGALAIAALLGAAALGFLVFKLLTTEGGLDKVKAMAGDMLTIFSAVADFLSGPGFIAFEKIAIAIAWVIDKVALLITWYKKIPEGIRKLYSVGAGELSTVKSAKLVSHLLGGGKFGVKESGAEVGAKEFPELASEVNKSTGELGDLQSLMSSFNSGEMPNFGSGLDDLMSELTPLTGELPDTTSDVGNLGSSAKMSADSISKGFGGLEAAIASLNSAMKSVSPVRTAAAAPSKGGYVPSAKGGYTPSKEAGEGLVSGARDVSGFKKEGYVPKKGDYSPVTSQTTYINIDNINTKTDEEELEDKLAKIGFGIGFSMATGGALP